MANDPQRVIVRRDKPRPLAGSRAHGHLVNLLELRAEADTPDQGARHLADHLRDARDGSSKPRRHPALGGTLATVGEFLHTEILPSGARP